MSEKSSTAAAWTDRFIAVYPLAFSGPNLEVARDMACNAESRPTEDGKCPFCRVFLRSRLLFVEHIGSQMEEVALMVLSRDHLDDLGDKSVISRKAYCKKLFHPEQFSP